MDYTIYYFDTRTRTYKSMTCERRHVLSTADLIGQTHKVEAILPPGSLLTLDTIAAAVALAQDALDPDIGLTSPPARISRISQGDTVSIRISPSIWAEGTVIAANNEAPTPYQQYGEGPQLPDYDDWYIELEVTSGTLPRGYGYWKQLQDGGTVTLLHRKDEDTRTAIPSEPNFDAATKGE